jgi:hypothetical protein
MVFLDLNSMESFMDSVYSSTQLQIQQGLWQEKDLNAWFIQ